MCRCEDDGAGVAPSPARRERIEWLEEYQRDLEQQTADVADEITRLKERSQATD